MFINTIHKEIDEKDIPAMKKPKILDADLDDGIHSQSIDPSSSQLEEESFVQQFGNQIYDLNRSDLNQSKPSNYEEKQMQTGYPQSMNRTAQKENKLPGGQLLHLLHEEGEKEGGLVSKDQNQKAEDKSKHPNTKSEVHAPGEPRLSVKDLISKFKGLEQKAREKAEENQKFMEKKKSRGPSLTRARSGGQENQEEEDINEEAEHEDNNDQQMEKHGPGKETRDLNASRSGRRSKIVDQQQREEDNEADHEEIVASNPFQIFNIEQQKESEEYFKSDIRETADFKQDVRDTANFEPLVGYRTEPNKYIEAEQADNPIRIGNGIAVSSNEGVAMNKSNYEAPAKEELQEIEENDLEHDESVREQTEKSRREPDGEKRENSQPNTSRMQQNQTKSNILALTNLNDNQEESQESENSTEQGEQNSQARVFKNMLYENNQNSSVSQNNYSGLQDHSLVARSQNTSQMPGASRREDLGNDKSFGKSQQNMQILRDEPRSESKVSYSKEEAKSNFDARNTSPKHENAPQHSGQGELNEAQRQFLQSLTEEQRRAILTQLLFDKDLGLQGDIPERISAVSKALEGTSHTNSQPESQKYLKQDDVDFFTKVLDLSAIPYDNELVVEFKSELLNISGVHEAKQKPEPISSAGASSNIKLEHQDSEKPQQELATNPKHPNVDKTKKKREIKIQQVEGLQYNPGLDKEQQGPAEDKPIDEKKLDSQENKKHDSQEGETEEQSPPSKKETQVLDSQQNNAQSNITSSSAESGEKAKSSNESLRLRVEQQIEQRDGKSKQNSSVDSKNAKSEISRESEGESKSKKLEFPTVFKVSSQEFAKNFVEEFFNKNSTLTKTLKKEEKVAEPKSKNNSRELSQAEQAEKKYLRGIHPTKPESEAMKNQNISPNQEDQTNKEGLSQSAGSNNHAESKTDSEPPAVSDFQKTKSLDAPQKNESPESHTSKSKSLTYLQAPEKIISAAVNHPIKGDQCQKTPVRPENMREDDSQNTLPGQPKDSFKKPKLEAYTLEEEGGSVTSEWSASSSRNSGYDGSDASRKYQTPSSSSKSYASYSSYQQSQTPTSEKRSSYQPSNYQPYNRYTPYQQSQTPTPNWKSAESQRPQNQTYSVSKPSAENTLKPPPVQNSRDSQTSSVKNNQEIRATEYVTLTPYKYGAAQKEPTFATPSSQKSTGQFNQTTLKATAPANREMYKSAQPSSQPEPKKLSMSVSYVEDLALDEGTRASIVPVAKINPNGPRFFSNVKQRTIFGFKTKKDLPYRPVEVRKVDRDVFCMNCEEFIAIEQVDSHSKVCSKNAEMKAQLNLERNITNDDHQLDAADVEELNQKIEKIISKINSTFKQIAPKNLNANFSDSCKRLIKIARDVVAEDNSLEVLQNKMQDFDQIFSPLAVSARNEEVSIIMYLQRLFVALQNKAIEFEKDYQKELEKLQEQLQQYERETLERKAVLELWEYQSKMLQEIQRHDARNMKYLKKDLKRDVEVLSQIHSDIDSMSNPSEDTVGTTESEFNMTKSSVKGGEAEREAQRRYFYTEAVNIKLTLPANHPGKNLLISELYDQCVAENIAEENYVLFIKKQYGIL